MRITFILPGYPSSMPIGGFRVVYEYANGLAMRGHIVTIIHPYSLSKDEPASDLSLRWVRTQWRKILRWQRTISPPKLTWQAMESRVRMVYLNGEPITKYIPDGDAVIATAWSTAKYVYSYPDTKGTKFHYVADYEHWVAATPEKQVSMAEAFALPLIKLAMSHASAEMAGQCDPKSPRHVVPLALNHSLYRVQNPIRDRQKYIIGMAYRTPDYKGAADGLDALRTVQEQFSGLRLILFGSSPLRHTLDPWMEYIQKPANDAIVALYNTISIFVVPSWAEGWGLPGMEAMACGAMLCSTDTGGVHEYAIHGQTALLSPAREPDLLARNIITLLEDDQLRYSLAEAGTAAVSTFTWTKAVSMFEVLLEQYAASYHARSH